MKVCFLHVGFLKAGGIERATSMLLNALCEEKDFEVHSLGLLKPEGANAYELKDAVVDSTLYDFGTTMFEALTKHKAIQKTVKYIKDNKIDIIVGCGSVYFLLAVIAAKLCHIKSICWEHTNPKITTEFKFQKQIRSFGCRFSSANVLITKKALSFYNAKRKKNNYLIYNPIDNALLDSEVCYNTDSKKIISVGRLEKVKNYDIGVELCKHLSEKFPDWSWDIYGDGSQREHLQKLIEENGVSHFLCLKGNSTEIYKKYDEYAFIVMTSQYEGFPMVLLEASARGLPLVSFDIETGPDEIICDGHNGYLIPDYNREFLLGKIAELMRDSEKRKSMSDNAQKRAKTFYLKQIIPEWKKVFEEVLYGN